MDADFWLRRWEANEISFHRSQANPLLVAHLSALPVSKGDRLFLPLCGRSLDIGWLLAHGYRVAGAELSELAVGQLFAGLGIEPRIAEIGALKRCSGPGIDIFVGDIFALTGEVLGRVDAVFDRAALVALPPEMRVRYARHLTEITGGAPQLLITYEYQTGPTDSPPFRVFADEVERHYGGAYRVRSLEIVEVEGGLRGMIPAKEHVWLLSRPTDVGRGD